MEYHDRVIHEPGQPAVEKLLGELELAIMEIAWQTNDLTVRDVLEQLTAQRHLAYTTVMTVMNRLVDKGLLTRTLSDRAGVYQAALTRDEFVQRQAALRVQALLTDFGEVAVAQFLAVLETADADRLEALERFLAERKTGAPDAG
jgi:predicted transcriptional regulator